MSRSVTVVQRAYRFGISTVFADFGADLQAVPVGISVYRLPGGGPYGDSRAYLYRVAPGELPRGRVTSAERPCVAQGPVPLAPRSRISRTSCGRSIHRLAGIAGRSLYRSPPEVDASHARRGRRRQRLPVGGPAHEAAMRRAQVSREGAHICVVCLGPLEDGKAGSRVVVEHDHKTNLIRGLVHSRCDSVLGYALDDPATIRNAAAYPERAQARRATIVKLSSGA